MKPTGVLALTILAILLTSAPPARGATVSGEVVYCAEIPLRGLECAREGDAGNARSAYRFVTEAGERSTATVGRTGDVLRFHDDTARVKAGPQCRQVDDNTAECDTAASPPLVSVSLVGGAADDVLAVTAPLSDAFLDGGGGADDLRGGGAREILSGGPGPDRISAGGGDDTVVGGPGPDRLEGGEGADNLYGDGGPDPDRVTGGTGIYGSGAPALGASLPLGGDAIDGGAGSDLVSYADHTAAVRADLGLSGSVHGAAGEGDSLAGVESVRGGSGDDTLGGNGAENDLVGGDGDDRLRGRGGPDVLTGGRGEDRFDGGSGNDMLRPVDREADELRCGSGSDLISEYVDGGGFDADGSETLNIVGPDAADGVHQDCELAQTNPPGGEDVLLDVRTRTFRLRAGRTLHVPNPCRFRAEDVSRRGRCRATVTVRTRVGGRAKSTARVRSARAASVRVPLRGGVAAAARRGRVAIAFRITRRSAAYGQSFTWTPRFTALLD